MFQPSDLPTHDARRCQCVTNQKYRTPVLSHVLLLVDQFDSLINY